MLTDSLDGWIARHYSSGSPTGKWLDPLADKIFVFCAILSSLGETSLSMWEILSLFLRDIAIIFLSIYLLTTQRFHQFKIRSVLAGKITTTLQFGVLISLSLKIPLPQLLFLLFPLLAIWFLIDLLRRSATWKNI